MMNTTYHSQAAHGAENDFLRRAEIFRNIPLPQLATLEKNMTEKRFAKGSVLFMDEDSSKFVWILKEGLVLITAILSDQERVMDVITPGRVFGGVMSTSLRDRCTARAKWDCDVLCLPAPLFMYWAQRFPELAMGLAFYLSRELQNSMDLRRIGFESAETRLIQTVLRLSRQFGPKLPFTRKEMAEMANTAVETSIRTFKVLEREGIIRSSRGEITLLHQHQLQERMAVGA